MWSHARSRHYKHNCSALCPLLVLLPCSLWLASYTPPPPTELLSECHLPFLRFAPGQRLSTSYFSACAPFASPSPLPFPPGLGSTAKKWSRTRARFDLGMNCSTAVSCPVQPLAEHKYRDIGNWKRTWLLCYIGVLYIADNMHHEGENSWLRNGSSKRSKEREGKTSP